MFGHRPTPAFGGVHSPLSDPSGVHQRRALGEYPVAGLGADYKIVKEIDVIKQPATVASRWAK